MEKRDLQPDCSSSTRHVVLFREDVEEVIDLLEAHVGEVDIADKTYEYANLDEVGTQRGERIHQLRITADAPGLAGSVSVSFEGGRISVTDALRAGSWELKAGLDQVLTRGRRGYLRFFEPYLWWGLSALVLVVGSVASLLAFMFVPEKSEVVLVMVAIAVALAHLVWLGSGVHARRRAALVLVRSHDRQGFLWRNWDKILLLVLGGVLSLLLDFIRRIIWG